MSAVFLVNGVPYPVNASAIARLVNQKLELLAALREVMENIGKGSTRPEIEARALAAIAHGEMP